MATSKVRDWTRAVEDDAGSDARPWPERAFEWVRHPSLLVGLVVYLVVLVVCIAGPIISRQSPNLQNGDLVFMKPSFQHPFGTDSFGRDVLTRVLYGGRSTMLGSFLVVAIGAPIGSALGLVAGYFRGVAGLVIMRLMDLLLAFPGILLALTVAAILGPGLINGVVAVAIVSIPAYARVVEGATIEIRGVPYVEAAITTGAGPLHIMWRHVLPNVFAGIAVLGSSWLGIAALWIASLGYLGLGVQPPQAEWGTMLNDGQSYITVAWWISLFPGIVLSAFVIASNLLGDGLRDRLDPTLGRRGGRTIG
jgi:ABC-type dipeptide/oligopeptide/nickel transport system permease subunit